jgi:hypothetical protein
MPRRRRPAAVLLGCLLLLQPARAGLTTDARIPARAADHVVLISIDGLRPAIYLEPDREGVRVPALQALRRAGSAAEGVVVSTPSMTYPSHTSLATGVHPARHGIVSNTLFDPPTGSRRWYFDNALMQAPALWDVVGRAGLRTAGVSWPVSVGARMDVLYPESNQAPRDRSWLAQARLDSTPGLVDAVVADLGGFGERDNVDPIARDRFAAAAALRIIRTARPNLLVVHLMETDSAQHADGPGSAAARAAFERVDAHVAALLAALDATGMRERTAIAVTGDHGFSRVHTLIQPNVILREAGLLTTSPQGAIADWRAAAHGLAIRLADPADRALGARVTTLFERLAAGRFRGIFRVVGREELDARGAYPDALLFLEPAEGYYVSDALEHGSVLVAASRRGAHGFLPTEPRMHSGLLLAGAGIRAGVPLPLVRQIDIAPTLARLLGCEMPDAEGVPMVGVLAGPARIAARGQ